MMTPEGRTTMDAVHSLDLNKRIDQYIQLRDKITEIRKKHKEELRPYNETQMLLSNTILQALNAAGVESARTDSGTAYKTLDRSATLADRSMFWDFVKENEAWDLIDYKANVTAVSDYIAEKIEAAKTDPSIIPAPPPGVNYNETWEIGVRRKTK